MGSTLETVAEGVTQWSLKYRHPFLLTIFFSINKAFYYGCLPPWLPPAVYWASCCVLGQHDFLPPVSIGWGVEAWS